MNAVERMEWMVRFLIVRFRFVHQILGMLSKAPSTTLDTMGVCVHNGQMYLYYNIQFVNGLTDAELVFVLYHEILHLVLHHCTHRRLSENDIAKIACDLAVNELIPEDESCKRPKMGTFVDEFRKMKGYEDLKNKQTAEYYYDYLMKKAPQSQPMMQGAGGNASAGGDDSDSAQNEGQDKKKSKQPKTGSFDSHEGWKEDELADTRVTAEVQSIDKSDMWGDVSGDCRQIIMEAQVKRFNWRSLVKQFLGAHASSQREVTRRRPNRRMGYLMPGSKREKVDRHLVVIDTSGSTLGFLPKFLAIINTMLDYLVIDVAQCDAGIVEEPKPFDRHKKQFEFKGMGGTNFQPIIDLVNEKNYRSVSIVTDGQAPECTKPKVADVIWVLPEGYNPPVDWGRVVHIDKDR